ALQGGFQKHQQTLDRIEVAHKTVRLATDLADIDGLILPGGESTTIIKLIMSYKLLDALSGFAKTKPIFGTCAGAIIISRKASNFNFPTLNLLDIEVDRNAYGRQIDSFYNQFEFNGKSVEAMFIRAPKITSVGKSCEVLASHNGLPVVVRNQSHMVCTAHPELTDETEIHRYFVDQFVINRKN
ncbi:MAG: pyridoxal 5'-phosphate synthase glutaminase subunit PdxT, partial [Calditrichaeota bacterium]|nr:pyridoxal 5'-phosphate synthase glutaminase subunit PdxT [Calditrichota bacterium]